MNAESYPDELKLATWSKVKGALPADNEVGDKLKALQRKHEAITWKLFEPGWPKSAKTAAELEQAFAVRDRSYRASVFALKKDANDVAAAAKKMSATKGAAKPVLDAAKAIGLAVGAYARSIDSGVDELQKAFELARDALPDEAEKDEPASALLDPKKLLAQLQALQRDPERKAQFGFVDAKEKQPPALAMHPKTAGRSLFATLQKATDVKAGSYGMAWIADKTLILQVEKAFSGLAKKVRPPLKAAGFRIAKIALWQADGTVLEQDDDPGDAAIAEGGAQVQKAKPSADEEAAFALRLKAALARLSGVTSPLAQKAKLLISEAGALARTRDLVQAGALLGQAESTLDGLVGNTTPNTPQPSTGASRAPADSIVLKQSGLVWSSTRDKVRGELQRLEAAILDVYEGENVQPDVTQAVRKLDSVLQLFDTSLAAKLVEASGATDIKERTRLHGEALVIIGRYRGFLAQDKLVQQLDANPFTPVAVQATLTKTLDALAAKLA